MLTASFAAAGSIGCLYLVAFGALPLLAVSMAHAAVTAPLAPLADALALSAARGSKNIKYGWVRAVGSTAFVAGTLLTGQLVDRFGLAYIIVVSCGLFALTAVFATRAEPTRHSRKVFQGPLARDGHSLWHNLVYRRVLLVAAMVIGSHAMNDAFAVISWQRAGLGSGSISLLWSLAVASEIIVFSLLGPWLLARFGPAWAAAIAAAAGILRWTVLGATTFLPALILMQASHGLNLCIDAHDRNEHHHAPRSGAIGSNGPDRLRHVRPGVGLGPPHLDGGVPVRLARRTGILEHGGAMRRFTHSNARLARDAPAGDEHRAASKGQNAI